MRTMGASRDRLILEGLERWKYLRADQIANLYFPTVKQEYKSKKTSERMRVMFKKGWVQRMRFPNEPYIYTLDKPHYSHKLNHYLMLVDVWITIRGMAPAQTNKLTCEPEKHFGNVITDLYIEYSNNFRMERKQFFIEVELDSTGSLEEKLLKYASLLYSRHTKGDQVVVLHKKKIDTKINVNIPVRFIPLGELEKKWQW